MKRFKIVTPALALAIIIAASVMSLPRLSAEQGSNCSDCHVNPNGAGMRTEFGNYTVGLNEFVLPQTKKYFVENYRSPRVSPGLTVGFDLRYLVFDDGRLFRMQTDAFLNFEPLKKLNLQIRFGEDPFGTAAVFESYAQFRFNKAIHLRMGKFNPAFGLHVEDHKSYVRDRTGAGSSIYLDGLAVGGNIKGFNYSVELFNPQERSLYGLHLFRAGNLGSFGWLGGGSVRIQEDDTLIDNGFYSARSVFAGIARDRVSLLTELVLSGESSDSLAFYAGLTTRIEYGLYLIGEYNFFDQDRDLADGVDEFYRISLEVYPIPFFQIRPSYTFYTEGPLKDEDQFFVQFHFGY